MVNIRQKGADGERKIATRLNEIIFERMHTMGLPMPDRPVVQRNQNQSAVGGGDLTGTFGMCIEIKCQETLSIPAWWKQCTTAAKRNNDMPVLIYKQNNKGWKVVLLSQLWIGPCKMGPWVISQISWDDFQEYFKSYVDERIQNGDVPRV